MKIHHAWLAALIIGLPSVTGPATAAPPELPSVNLKVSGGARTLTQFRYIQEPFFTKELTEASGGAVTTTFGSLEDLGIQGPEVLRLLSLGMFDISEGTLSYMAGEAAQFEALDLPGLTENIDEQRRMAEGFRAELEKIMAERFNVKLLSLSARALQVLYCNKPVTGLGDLAGLKVRTTNRSTAELIEALGAQSINLPFAEVVPALDRGVVDCAVTGTEAGNTARWWEVSDHLVILPLGWSMTFFGANAANWARLPAETQAFLAERLTGFEDRHWKQASLDVQDGINCNIGSASCKAGVKADRPMTLVELSADDKALAKRLLTEKVLSSWAERCGGQCVSVWNANVGSVVNVQAGEPK